MTRTSRICEALNSRLGGVIKVLIYGGKTANKCGGGLPRRSGIKSCKAGAYLTDITPAVKHE